MRVLGLAGLVLALALVGYLIVGYLGQAGKAQQSLETLPGPADAGKTAVPDLTRRGLEERLAPVLDAERKRVEEAGRAAGQ
jgi:hypothetical protein